MARLWSSGAELNSTTANMEVTATSGTTVAIETTPIRSGTYSFSTTASTSAPFFTYQPTASTTDTSTWFIRVYLYITSLPAADRYVLSVVNSSVALGGGLKITTTGAIQLFQGSGGAGTQVGSNGPTLNTGQWYRLELKIKGTNAGTGELRGLLDGVEFAGSATANTQYVHTVRWGNAGGGNTNLDFNIDDIAINDDSGSFQNSWPGEGEIIHLNVDSDGDNSQWGNGAASFNYENVDENTPDDATTVNTSTTVNEIDDYNLAATPAAMASDDTINCVQVGVRVNEAASQTDAIVLRIKASASGTVEESGNISVTNSTWFTNANAAPRNYPLTLYDLPGASTTAWTKADLDTTQIGQRLTISGGAFNTQVSKVWLLVDHAPASGGGGGAFAYIPQRMRMGMGI